MAWEMHNKFAFINLEVNMLDKLMDRLHRVVTEPVNIVSGALLLFLLTKPF